MGTLAVIQYNDNQLIGVGIDWKLHVAAGSVVQSTARAPLLRGLDVLLCGVR